MSCSWTRISATEHVLFLPHRIPSVGGMQGKHPVMGVNPFRSVPKSFPPPIKERSVVWPTLNSSVAKRIPSVANLESACGQSCVLASILLCFDAKTVMN